MDTNYLMRFVRESNAIERILRLPTGDEIAQHVVLLGRERLTVRDIEDFVHHVADARLRCRAGMDVFINGTPPYIPPPGGADIETALTSLLEDINLARLTPWEAHCEYETLHPFTDGNGRSGRAIWLWHMQSLGRDPFRFSFLHEFYYQSLAGSRT
jgi:hypothetical protein